VFSVLVVAVAVATILAFPQGLAALVVAVTDREPAHLLLMGLVAQAQVAVVLASQAQRQEMAVRES
jgi:hypothetical protein